MAKYTETDIWKDPRVVNALKEGRFADGIAILECPECARWGYYNESSHFTCLFCDKNFYVLSEGESREVVPCVQADTVISLADTMDVGEGP